MRPYRGEFYTRMTPPLSGGHFAITGYRRVVLQHVGPCQRNADQAVLLIAEPHEECIGWVVGVIQEPVRHKHK